MSPFLVQSAECKMQNAEFFNINTSYKNRFIFSQDKVAKAKLHVDTASRRPRSIAEKETI